MPVRLRPHHLLCMLTFAGEGYSDAFVANFKGIVERLREGENVQVVSGPDDVCAPLCGDRAGFVHCNSESVRWRDDAARLALAQIPQMASLFGVSGMCVDPATLAALRVRFTSGEIRGACEGCEWSALCTQISADGYAAAHH